MARYELLFLVYTVIQHQYIQYQHMEIIVKIFLQVCTVLASC